MYLTERSCAVTYSAVHRAFAGSERFRPRTRRSSLLRPKCSRWVNTGSLRNVGRIAPPGNRLPRANVGVARGSRARIRSPRASRDRSREARALGPQRNRTGGL